MTQQKNSTLEFDKIKQQNIGEGQETETHSFGHLGNPLKTLNWKP